MNNSVDIKSQTVQIVNELGLHARAAASFVKVAGKYPCEVKVEKDGMEVNGKSIMGVMMLAAPKGSFIKINVSGEGAEEALADLVTLINNKFGEER
ncbi:HPr family phosphocarrier protein [Deferribacterales bacterium Es71-Z0220]|uniref:HPr family phosphocarrier protein n=1 Tax=Deferrivibrio essentukiensis TaxID=2880922 RepID=UPI001F61B95B|nr:HPr family phosphocarrier protein [Deferrivibrio essentukiensis]MCB4204487.1 HPr family phosphocarrier protein [Deferrivibrio essentukiensis]